MLTVPPLSTREPAVGSVDITSPAGTVSEYSAGATSMFSPAFSSVALASARDIPISPGVGVNRPAPNHQAPPPNKAITSNATISMSGPRRERRSGVSGSSSGAS